MKHINWSSDSLKLFTKIHFKIGDHFKIAVSCIIFVFFVLLRFVDKLLSLLIYIYIYNGILRSC